MGATKKNIDLSDKHKEVSKKLENALKKVSEKIIAKTKKNNSYLVIAGKNGKVKNIPAKDL
jgi:hypothetical protein